MHNYTTGEGDVMACSYCNTSKDDALRKAARSLLDGADELRKKHRAMVRRKELGVLRDSGLASAREEIGRDRAKLEEQIEAIRAVLTNECIEMNSELGGVRNG